MLSIADVADGRYILMSARRSTGHRLSCWDTQTHEFIYQKSLDGVDHPGYIVEALPGL